MLTVARMIGPWILIAGLAVALALAAGTASAGISADLAKKCQGMAVKAHPSELYVKSNSADLQRRYFGECVARNGNMDEDATVGSGSRDDR
jgi:hypothetical protein